MLDNPLAVPLVACNSSLEGKTPVAVNGNSSKKMIAKFDSETGEWGLVEQ